MSVSEILTTAKFERQYKKLPELIQKVAKEKEFIFRNNIFDSRLDIHKLHGREKEAWAFSINRSYRIKFIFLVPGSVLFLEIGTHDIYK